MVILLIFKWLICFFSVTYILLIAIYYVSWLRLPEFIFNGNESFTTKVSVIIPARNEEEKIEDCIDYIYGQSYPGHLYEVIIVDDNSNDKTKDIVNKYIDKCELMKISLISLNDLENFSSYKKRALSVGIENATGTLIISSDADCILDDNWISSIVSNYEKYKPKFISAPVTFHNYYTKTFFSKVQSLE